MTQESAMTDFGLIFLGAQWVAFDKKRTFHNLKKKSVKAMEDEFVSNLTQKLCFLESNSCKYCKLLQTRP